jgi:hypothetical protein
MRTEQIIIGALVVLLCVQGLWSQRWLLEQTRKGQRLVRRFGPKRAALLLRAILVGGLLFGALLAANVIRPVQW